MCVFNTIKNKLGNRDSLIFRENPGDPNSGEIFFKTSKRISQRVLDGKGYKDNTLDSINKTISDLYPEQNIGNIANFAEDAGGNKYIKIEVTPRQYNIINEIQDFRNQQEIEKDLKKEEELSNITNRLRELSETETTVDGNVLPPAYEQQEILEDTSIPEDLKDDIIDDNSIDSFEKQSRENELNSRRFNSRLTPVDKPIGENFEEVVNWKASQLAQINFDLERAKMSLASGESVEKRKKIKQLENKKSLIEDQLTYLNENSQDLSLQTVFEDLDNIEEAIKSKDIHDVDEVRQSLDFYDGFIKSIASDDIFKKLSDRVNGLKGLYLRGLKSKINNLLEQESLVTNMLENLNNDPDTLKRLGKKEGEQITLDDLLIANRDISNIDANVLGLISSRVSDTIIPQYLLHSYQKALNEWENIAFTYIDRLRDFTNREGVDKVDRQSLLERDSGGVLTGNLVNLTSTQWGGAQKDRSNLVKDFTNSKYSRKKVSYIKVLNWYKKNTDAINFFKLRAVRDLYGNKSEYSSYFIYDDNVMDEYEKELRDTLGPLYEETINNLFNKLQKYELFLVDEAQSENFEAKKARQNVWEFLKKYNNADITPMSKTQDGYDVYFSYFNDFLVIPKKNKTSTKKNELGEYETINQDSGYYSRDFDEIRADDKKLELWNIYKSMSEFINSTYDIENFGRIKAPMIEEQYMERILKGFEGGRDNRYGRIGKFAKESTNMLKEFYFERGLNSENKRGISKNMIDTSSRAIKNLTKAKMLLGKSYEQANREARAELYNTYSTDLDNAFNSSMINAAAHQARMKLDPIAEIFRDYLKENYKDRKRSNHRLDLWINKVVKNRSFASRGKGGVGAFEPVEWFENKKAVKEIRKQFRDILNYFSGKPTLEGAAEVVIPKKILRLLSDQEKLILDTYKQLSSTDVKDFQVSDTIGDDTFYFEKETAIDKDGNEVELFFLEPKDIDSGRHNYSKEDFTRHLNDYLARKVNDIGLTLNIAGIADGILTSNLIVGMGLKPVSGVYQRWEGKTTNMIMDTEGWYWTPGNLQAASEFMSWTNVRKVSTRLLKNDRNFLKKKEQMVVFEQLLERMSVLQQRSDELQKDTEGAGEMLDVFAMAITLPEFKNQGEIVLSIMADFEIQDDTGKKYKFFDPVNKDFPAFTLSNGVLALKPQFSGLKLNDDYIQNMVLRVGSTIKEIQGNYDRRDVFGVKSHWLGRGFTQYFTWLPEFYNRRFGTVGNENLNVNLAQGREKLSGRYVRGAESSLASTITFSGASLAIAYGFGGIAGAVVGIPLSMFFLYKMFSSIASRKSLKNDVNSIVKLANFVEAVATEYINLPSKVGSAIPILNRLRIFDGKNKTFTNESLINKMFGETDYNTMRPEEKGALKAMALELAVMLQGLSLKLIVGAMLYDEDDDELSDERLRYNFIQNQLSKAINTFNILGTAPELIEGGLENGIVKTIVSLYDTMKLVSKEKYSDAGKSLVKVLPVPSDIRNITGEGLYPWQNKTNFDDNAFVNSLGTMSWVSRYIKDTQSGGETSAKSKWREMRTEDREKIRKDFRDISGNKDVLKIVADNILDEKYLDKNTIQRRFKQEVTYQDMLELQEEYGSNVLKDRDVIISKLVRDLKEKTNLTNDEIIDIVERRSEKY